MKRTKQEWEEIVGHTIRNDTYQVLERIQTGEQFEDIVKDLNENREKYGIKTDVSLVKIKTIEEYLEKIGIELVEKKYITKRADFSNISGYGIYGIYINDDLIYIGYTEDFRQRFRNHHTCFNHSDKPLYQRMRLEKEEGNQVSIKPLINIEELDVLNSKITERDLQAMELALITLYKPPYNYEGVRIPYQFGNKRSQER